MRNAIDNLKNFITAGKAIFTCENEDTGNRFTFRVTKKETDRGNSIWFVSVLSGSCNESDYSYMGMIDGRGNFKTTRASKVTPEALSFKAFSWIWRNITKDMPKSVTFRHEGRCGRCGRKLTTPDSIDAGFGPECIQHI